VAGLTASLGLPSSEMFDEPVRKALLRYQSAHSLPLSGICDLATAMTLP
jgi:hypothetical protein